MKLCLSPVAGVSLVTLLGCAAPPLDQEPAEETVATDSSGAHFSSLRRDYRECLYPHCGGYFLHDLNVFNEETYVYKLDYSASGLNEEDISVINHAPINQVVIRGTLGPVLPFWNVRALIVLDAYVGMPDKSPRSSDAFYIASQEKPPKYCVVAPCNNDLATLVNTPRQTEFTSYSIENAAASFVDRPWLTSRVKKHGALVAATLEQGTHYPGGYEIILNASQVYVHLPEHVGPCARNYPAFCGVNQVATFRRNEDRCLVPDVCVEARPCPLWVPLCDQGYTLESWPAEPNGCPAYACDAFR